MQHKVIDTKDVVIRFRLSYKCMQFSLTLDTNIKFFKIKMAERVLPAIFIYK